MAQLNRSISFVAVAAAAVAAAAVVASLDGNLVIPFFFPFMCIGFKCRGPTSSRTPSATLRYLA